MTKFVEKLDAAMQKNRSLLCVGLDPVLDRLPSSFDRSCVDSISRFIKEIIQATSDLVCAYKPNLAFFEAHGSQGLRVLDEILESIPENIPVIGDGKRGDIGNSSARYAEAFFETMGFDALTVNPYMGRDSLEPFLEYEDKAAFILCLTSNPGSADFQRHHGLYLEVARLAGEWNSRGNIGLVVGAQHSEELERIRQIVGDMPILVPGVGAQGGDLEAVMASGLGGEALRLIVNTSRKVLYASSGADFAERAREAASRVVDQMRGLPGSDLSQGHVRV